MIEIRQLSGRKQLECFVQFAIDLYRGNDCYVPPLIASEVDGLMADCNPAFDFCEALYLMAYRDGKAVGRIAGFINHRYNEQSGESQCRFGYVDFIDDEEVSHALLDAIAEWGRSKGLKCLVGPLGLTDLDYEGCLIEGFDQLSTIVTIYNHPYYRRHFEAYGLNQDAVWNEYRIRVPDRVPERHLRVAEMVKRRFKYRVIRPTSSRQLMKQYGSKIFGLLNEAYAPLYGYSSLTQKQIDYYIKLYLPLLRLDCIRLVVDSDDNVVAFGITCPSLSRAQQKAKGRLWPFGWIHLLKAMYVKGATRVWDLYLVAVRPDLHGKGVNALLFSELIPQAISNGYEWVESNPELSTNYKVQEQWDYFERTIHKRRCTFRGDL